MPVCEMLGGPVRDQLRLYWSHCGAYRLHHAEEISLPPVRNLDDICKRGEHVRDRRFTALKTNIFLFDGAGPELYMPGFFRSPGGPELNPPTRVEEALDKQLAAFRDGTDRAVEFLLDLNFKTEGYVRLVRALEQREHRLMWVEIDSFDPGALALIRRSITTPFASCEPLFGRRQFKGFLESYAMDRHRRSALERHSRVHEDRRHGRGHEVNCAPHNFYGHMSTLISAHFCARIPELPHHGDRRRRSALER